MPRHVAATGLASPPEPRPDMPAVGDLILLAAPSCCGKTRFLEQLEEGRLPGLAATLGITGPVDSWVSLIPRELGQLAGRSVPRMILHFAIPTIAIVEGELTDLSAEPRLEVLRHAERVTAVTLVASAGTLAARWRRRNRLHRKMLVFNFRQYFAERRRMQKLKLIYADPRKIAVAYEAWLTYVNGLSNLKESWLVTAEDDYEAFPAGEWQQLRRRYLQAAGRDHAIGRGSRTPA